MFLVEKLGNIHLYAYEYRDIRQEPLLEAFSVLRIMNTVDVARPVARFRFSMTCIMA